MYLYVGTAVDGIFFPFELSGLGARVAERLIYLVWWTAIVDRVESENGLKNLQGVTF